VKKLRAQRIKNQNWLNRSFRIGIDGYKESEGKKGRGRKIF
jgi:hypothetical protein